MSVQTEQALSQAFELIEADQLEAAQTILKPLLNTEKDNPDVWWLYAHAVSDPETARFALNEVRRLNPEYLNVSELLYTLENQLPAAAASNKEPNFVSPPVPSTLPGLSSEDDPDWDLPEDEVESLPLFRRPVFLLIVGSLIFVIIAALVILQPGASPRDVTATPLAPTQEILDVIPTTGQVEEIADATPAQTSIATAGETNYDNLLAALENFDIAEEGISVEETDMGNTLITNICAEAGANLRETLPRAMTALASQANNLREDLEALGTRMVDCSTGTTLLVIGVPFNEAQAYVEGSIGDQTFQAQWRPITAP